MMTLLQAIGEILRPAIVERGAIVLKELGERSTCGPITLHKKGQALVVRPDSVPTTIAVNDRLFPLFKYDVPGLAAMCDYIVFGQEETPSGPKLFVLLCELKSQNVGGSRNQIEKGRLLADYVISVASHQHEVQARPDIVRRGIVFSPAFNVPKGDQRKFRCKYQAIKGGFEDLAFAYYKSGADYPLEHFYA